MLTDRVAPGGHDYYPTYWDSVSYLTFPSAGCWDLTLRAGEREEQINLQVD